MAAEAILLQEKLLNVNEREDIQRLLFRITKPHAVFGHKNEFPGNRPCC